MASVASKLSPAARLKTSPSLQIPLPFLLQIHLLKKKKALCVGGGGGAGMGDAVGADGSPLKGLGWSPPPGGVRAIVRGPLIRNAKSRGWGLSAP